MTPTEPGLAGLKATRPNGRWYVRAPRVVTASAAGVLNDGVIAIEGSTIRAVGTAAEMATELSTGVVQHFSEATVLPGLIDAHAHLTFAADRRPYELAILDSDEMMALTAVVNLQRHLASGVTTIRDNGSRNRVTFTVREAIERGYFVGPRLLLSGRPLTHTHGHFHWCGGVADGAEAIRAMVRELVAEGADHIKIMASGGRTVGTLPHYASYTTDELRVAVDTAHGLGRLTTAHCRAKQSMVNAVEAGLDCIEHAEFLVPDDDIVECGGDASAAGVMVYDARVTDQLLQAGTFVSYTMQAGGYDSLVELRTQREHETLSRSDEIRWGQLESFFDKKLTIFQRLLTDGMLPRLLISSDAGPFDCAFGRMHYGLKLGVEGGMTPAQAIESVTRVAAEACGVSRLVGTLEPGKQADLLVVRGNPLLDIERVADVEVVIQAGRALA